MSLMPNIAILRKDLIDHDFRVTAFDFRFKRVDYVVVFEALDSEIKIGKRNYCVSLTFYNGNESLHVYANSNFFHANVKDIRLFFGIEYAENLGDLMKQFYSRFNPSIPLKKPISLTDDQKQKCIRIINDRVDEANKIYCYDVRRNGKRNDVQYHRSPYNSDKTLILRPKLYSVFKNDKTLSFYYSDDPDDEKTDAEIIQNLADRNLL